MFDLEIQEGNDYDKLPYLDEKELGRDFMDLYREVEDWDVFESELLDELIDNLGWLSEKEPEMAREAVDILKISAGSGEPIKDRLRMVDERIVHPIFLRLLDIFSEKKGFKYLWSSANYDSVENDDHYLIATFDISLKSAKEHYYNSLSGSRKEPCIVRLSIESLVKKYRNSSRHEMELFFEHAPESAFESVDLKSDLEGLDIKVFKGIKEEKEEEKKLTNPMGHLVAIQIVEIDESVLEIQWVSPTYKPTRFSEVGAQSEMYKFLRKKYPDLKKSVGAGFFILTDDNGNPTEIGDIGDHKNSVKLIGEVDN